MLLILLYLFCFITPPLLLIVVYFLKHDYTHWRKYIGIYSLLIALFAYSYVPISGDLNRYLLRLDDFSNLSFGQAINNFYWLDFGETSWNWIVAKLGLPGLYSGVPQFIIFLIASYITCDYLERNNHKEDIFKALAFQFLLIPEVSTINNVFVVLAFSICAYAIYRDLIQKKNNVITIALYVFPLIIHTSSLIVISLRLLAIFIKRFKYGAFILAFSIPFLLTVLYKNIHLFSNYRLIYNVISRGYFYYSESEGNPAYKISKLYFLDFIHNMLFSFLTVYISLKITSKNKEASDNTKRSEGTFLTFLLLLSIVAISCIVFSAPHYWRFNFVIKLCLAVLLLMVNDELISNRIKKIVLCLFVCDGIMVKFTETIDLIRISDLGHTLINFFYSSPYMILYKLLMRFLNIY